MQIPTDKPMTNKQVDKHWKQNKQTKKTWQAQIILYLTVTVTTQTENSGSNKIIRKTHRPTLSLKVTTDPQKCPDHTHMYFLCGSPFVSFHFLFLFFVLVFVAAAAACFVFVICCYFLFVCLLVDWLIWFGLLLFSLLFVLFVVFCLLVCLFILCCSLACFTGEVNFPLKRRGPRWFNVRMTGSLPASANLAHHLSVSQPLRVGRNHL